MPGKPKAQRLLSCHRLADLPEFAAQLRSYNGFDLPHSKKCHRQGFVSSKTLDIPAGRKSNHLLRMRDVRNG